MCTLKLRLQYEGLTIQAADGQVREEPLAFAGIPDFLKAKTLCLLLPAEADGFVVCGRARVLRGASTRTATVLHSITSGNAS